MRPRLIQNVRRWHRSDGLPRRASRRARTHGNGRASRMSTAHTRRSRRSRRAYARHARCDPASAARYPDRPSWDALELVGRRPRWASARQACPNGEDGCRALASFRADGRAPPRSTGMVGDVARRRSGFGSRRVGALKHDRASRAPRALLPPLWLHRARIQPVLPHGCARRREASPLATALSGSRGRRGQARYIMAAIPRNGTEAPLINVNA